MSFTVFWQKILSVVLKNICYNENKEDSRKYWTDMSGLGKQADESTNTPGHSLFLKKCGYCRFPYIPPFPAGQGGRDGCPGRVLCRYSGCKAGLPVFREESDCNMNVKASEGTFQEPLSYSGS